MQDKDITPRDIYGQPHGYWESYWDNGNPWVICYFNHGKRHGPYIAYWSNGNLMFKGNHMNGQRYGYWIEFNLKTNEFDKTYYAK